MPKRQISDNYRFNVHIFDARVKRLIKNNFFNVLCVRLVFGLNVCNVM